jgi:hypothetical protein
VVSIDSLVRVLVEHVSGARGEVYDDASVDRRLACGDPGRRRTVGQRSGEECPRSRGIASLGYENVDDLAVLIDRAVDVVQRPATLT